jgi:hypothetical protein
MKVIDCFIFYNELDMLEFRLNDLNDLVDYFVLVECIKTHSNNDKELYFENNKTRFSKFLDKIIHIIVKDNIPQTSNSMDRENYQRNCIDEGIKKLSLNNDDIIIIADLDEIPDTKTVLNLKNNNRSLSYNKGNRLAFQTDSYGNLDGGAISHSSKGVSYNGVGGVQGNVPLVLSNSFTANNFHSSFYYAGLTVSGGPWWNGNTPITWRSPGSNAEINIHIRKPISTYSKSNSATMSVSVLNGYYIANSLTQNQFYKDGSLLGTASIPAGSTMSNAAPSFAIETAIYQSFTTFGYGLTNTEAQQLNTIVQAYQTDLGRTLF